MTTNQIIIPKVTEKDGRFIHEHDIYSRLLKDRIVFLPGPLIDEAANSIIAQMLFLSNEDPKKDIHFYINSPGGSITAGLAIYDTMQFLRCDVATYCVGQAASMAAVLLAAGSKSKRYLLPNSSVMLHQPRLDWSDDMHITDQQIRAAEIMRLRERLYHIIAILTDRDLSAVEKDCDREHWMCAEEAIEYGLADRILQKAPEIVREQEQEQEQE